MTMFNPNFVRNFDKLAKLLDCPASTVGTSTSNIATFYPFQRKSFYANGRFWTFYSDGTNIVYRTSTDGITWSAATTVRAATAGTDFSVWFDGTYLHYAYASTSSIYYRRGTPNTDGTITWSADEQVVSTTTNKAYFPFVSVDSDGYVWIGYTEPITAPNDLPWVIKSGNNDGTWGTTPAGFPYQLNATYDPSWHVSIIPLTNGKMLAVYAYSSTVRVRRWNGSSWGTEKATTSSCYLYSAVAQGDDVHIVFINATTYDILHVIYTYSTDSLSAEHTVISATGSSYPVLSIDNNNKLYCFWATKTTGTPSGATANHIYYQTSEDGGSTWSAMTDWIDESTEVLTYANRLICFYKDYGDKIGLMYMTKTAYPYNIRFDFLTVAVPPKPKGTIAIHAKLLGII